MSKKRTSRKKKKDSGYLLPIVCIVSITLLSAVLIALCIIVFLSSEVDPPVTTTSEPTAAQTTLPMSTPAVSDEPSVTTVPNTSDPSAPTTVTPSTSPSPVTTPPTTTEPVTMAPVTTQPPVTTEKPNQNNELAFKADLSAFEKYMDPTGDRWDDAYLMLVNVNNKLEPNQEKTYPVLGELKAFSDSEDYNYRHNPSLTMNENAMMALSAMFIEAKANGIRNLDITSAYRSYSRQDSIFNSNCDKTYHWLCEDDGCSADWIGKDSTCPICGKKTTDNDSIPITQEEKEANVATYSCAPGTSDHQTGLAVDIVDLGLPSEYLHLIQAYGETESGKWLAENCWKFGFVLRFPPDKEEITGIIYEPWHFRFVGRTHAAEMRELNMCLEEYTEHLESIGYFD